MFIFAVFCILIVLALLASLVMPGFLNNMNVGFYLIIIATFSISALVILIRKHFSFFKTLSIYICIFLTVFIIVEGAMIYFSENDIPSGQEEAIIVTGSGLFVESRLTAELTERLDCAISIYSQNLNLPIVLSGGTDENRALPECIAMQYYVENKVGELGIPMPVIITDPDSSSVYKNIENSLKKANCSSAYVIVSRHNVARSKIILSRISPTSTVLGTEYPYSKYIIYYIREFGYAVKTALLEGTF